jgi:hypothetical protein
MPRTLTGRDLSAELLAVLHRWGVPKHVVELNLHIRTDQPVAINCTFHPEAPDGSLALDSNDQLQVLTKRYQLVEVDG